MLTNLPPNTVERLSLYRRKLLNFPYEKKPFIHSHQLAHLLRINPAHIRRDLMLMGFSGDVHKGYDIRKLIKKIGQTIDCDRVQKVAFVGIGDLGRAVAEYFNNADTHLKVAATFRLTEEPKIQFTDVQCYNIAKMKGIIKKEGIELIVLAVPPSYAQEMSKTIISAGVKGILNFTSANLEVPKHIYIEEYDMISKLEKLSYFTNK